MRTGLTSHLIIAQN